MVTTVGAINKKDVNNLYKENEDTGGEKPIDLIKATNPILIVDEPQSVDGGLSGKGKEALEKMQPLCTLRYSATHIDKHNMLYRLDAVDAYEKGLVKKIEVASLEIESSFNKPYIKLISTHNKNGSISAKIEIDILRGTNVKREIVTVEDGDDLENDVTNRDIYVNMQIGTITCGKNNETVEIKGSGIDCILAPGESINGVSNDDEKRFMIRRTIKEHLDKEIFFINNKKDIKVLSLFFIDVVEHYRKYDESSQAIKGKYAIMFEEEYSKLVRLPEYQTLFAQINLDTDVSLIHNGYFSIDKKIITPFENIELNKSSTSEAVEQSSYNLIMKDKEKLLSFDTKLKFIFSHSALKEGWDNPNVFQICTLRDIGSERERRQTIGRGLRLCVNQKGVRIREDNVNTLTVVATERYEEFAENLQKEIERDTGIKFGVVEKHQFAGLYSNTPEGELVPIGADSSEKIWNILLENEYINPKGKIEDNLRTVLKENSLVLPEEFDDVSEQIKNTLKKLAGKLEIKNADERRIIKTKKEIFTNPDFVALWEKIKYKTTYKVNFDNDKLIQDSADAIMQCPPITKAKARFRKADIGIGKSGVTGTETEVSKTTTITEKDIEIPDIISDLQDKTQLTRKTIVEILVKSKRLSDFQKNPQQFIEYAIEAINRTKRLAVVDGIKYQKIGNEYYYAQELFEQEELKG